MTVGQLRAWLLNMPSHSNSELLRVFRQCYYNEVEGTTPGENRIIDQVLMIYNIAGDLPFAQVMVNVLGTFQMSRLKWDFGSADWRLTSHIVKQFLGRNQHLLPNLTRGEAPEEDESGCEGDEARDISNGNNNDNNKNISNIINNNVNNNIHTNNNNIVINSNNNNSINNNNNISSINNNTNHGNDCNNNIHTNNNNIVINSNNNNNINNNNTKSNHTNSNHENDASSGSFESAQAQGPKHTRTQRQGVAARASSPPPRERLKLTRESLRAACKQFNPNREFHYGFIVQRGSDRIARKDLRIAVEDEGGQRFVFDHKAMEDDQSYRLHLQVAFQVPDAVVEEGIPFCNERGIRGAYVVEITTSNRHLFPNRFLIEGIAGKKIVPPKAAKGQKQMGAHHEIFVPRSLNDRFPTIRYWLRNTFTNELHLEEGDKVWFTTLTTGYKNRMPAIDSIVIDFASKEKDVRWATDTRLQESLLKKLGVRFELGSTVGSSLLPGFPAGLEDSVSASFSPDLIGQMLVEAKAYHLREHDPNDPENIHTTGLRRLLRAEQRTPLSVLINPLNFKSIKREAWPRLIDIFFMGKQSSMVDKFYLITGLHEATNEANFHTINDFSHRFATDVTNRLSEAWVIDHTVFGRAEGLLSGDTEIRFKDYGDSPKVGLLVFEAEARAHTFQGTVSSISTGRLGEESEVCSINIEHFQKDAVITVSYPTDRDGMKQREALAYLRGLGIASVPKRGAPAGWEQRHIRCDSSDDAKDTLSILLAPPSAGENPLLAMIDEDFSDCSTKFTFDSRHGDIFYLFCSFTGPIPTVRIGEGSFVCHTGDLDLDKLAQNCLQFNTSNQSVITQFLSITHKDRVRWIKAPKVPEAMLHLGMDQGPGYLLIPDVPISIQKDLVDKVVRSVYSDFRPGKSVCDFVELPNHRGVGIKFWVPDKARADDLEITMCHRTLRVLDGDLMATTVVQGVFREEARGHKRPVGELMGTPTPKHRMEARAIGTRLLSEGLAMSNAVSELLEGFKAVDMAGLSSAHSARVSPARSSGSPSSSLASEARKQLQPARKGAASNETSGNRSQKKKKRRKAVPPASVEILGALVEEEEDEASAGDGGDVSASREDSPVDCLRPDPAGMEMEDDIDVAHEDHDAIQEEQERCDSLGRSDEDEGDDFCDHPNSLAKGDSRARNKDKRGEHGVKTGKGAKGFFGARASPPGTRSRAQNRMSPRKGAPGR